MAHHKSAVKRNRQNTKRRSRNRSNLTRVKTAMKKLRSAVAAGDKDAARDLLPATVAQIDKAAKKGAFHANTAARSKSRLTRHVNELLAS